MKATYLLNYLLRVPLSLRVEVFQEDTVRSVSWFVQSLLVPQSRRRSELWRLVGQDYWDIKID